MALKWGFACAGKLAHDYLNAMGTLKEGEHEVVAIADPMVHQAHDLAKIYGIPKVYDNFLDLAEDPNVEIVHVAALNPKHFEVAMLMLQYGKHVLVQKPMCMNEKQASKLIAYAKEKNLFLMEGIWSRVYPSYQYIRKQIDSGKFGDILSVEVDFGNADMANVERATKNALGGGSVLDLGVYNIQFCQFVFREEPKSIKATGKLNDDGVDLEMTAELNYGGNRVGKIRSSLTETLSNTAKIIGTKGTMTIPSFWTPTSIIDIDGTEKTFPQPAEAKHEFHYKNSIGLRYEPDEVRKCIRAGKKESDNVSHKESLIFVRIEDEIRRQIACGKNESDIAYITHRRMVKMITNFARTGDPSIENDVQFKSSKSPNELTCHEITNDRHVSITTDILKQLHFDTWSEIEKMCHNISNREVSLSK